MQRLQAECLRAGVGHAPIVVAAALDLPELLATVHRRCGVAPGLRPLEVEARLLLDQVAVAGDLAVADIDDRLVRIVERADGRLTVRRRSGPLGLGRDQVAPGVPPLGTGTAVATGPVTATVLWALWARNGRGPRPPARCEVPRQAFAALERELLALSPTQRLLLPAVAPEEVDTVVLGAGFLRGLADRWEAPHLLVVSTSIAEEQLRRAASAADEDVPVGLQLR